MVCWKRETRYAALSVFEDGGKASEGRPEHTSHALSVQCVPRGRLRRDSDVPGFERGGGAPSEVAPSCCPGHPQRRENHASQPAPGTQSGCQTHLAHTTTQLSSLASRLCTVSG